MQKYKSLAIKIGLVAAVLAMLASPYGRQHADEIKPLLEMVLSQ
jgi:hypothetical protein